VREEDAELYRKHADELIRFAAVVAGPSSADDVVSAAVLRVFASSAWPTVVERRAYLYRAVLHEARQQHRSTERRLRREARAAAREAESPALVRAEVLDALRRLTVRQRAIVFLTYWADLSVIDVAERLGVSRRTVERELTTARARMEVLLR
jgi:RNA polymerase sigma-70 factor (ECF subfamily)